MSIVSKRVASSTSDSSSSASIPGSDRMFQLNGNYSLSKTTNDTDGQGSTLFPMNSYDTSGEFGRGSFDIRNRFTLFGTINLPWKKIVVNPRSEEHTSELQSRLHLVCRLL